MSSAEKEMYAEQELLRSKSLLKVQEVIYNMPPAKVTY